MTTYTTTARIEASNETSATRSMPSLAGKRGLIVGIASCWTTPHPGRRRISSSPSPMWAPQPPCSAVMQPAP